MNEQTIQALAALAVKLGTTTEYLWSVLVKQAPIYGLTQLAMLLAISAVWFAAFWSLRAKTTPKWLWKTWGKDESVIGWQQPAPAARTRPVIPQPRRDGDYRGADDRAWLVGFVVLLLGVVATLLALVALKA